ncbi:MAG: PsbP-related protein [Patescibacteria group bacterium]
MTRLSSFKIIIIIIIVIITVLSIVVFLVQPKKTISPISYNPQENKTIVASDIASEKQPPTTLKEYTDEAGFSFKYPDDVLVTKKEANDSTIYANLELTSNQKGSISIKIADSKLKSIDDWFKKSKLGSEMTNKKEIKIGEIPGSEMQVDNKLLVVALDQDILFTIEVSPQDQKYWLNIYDTILSSFNFVPQPSKQETETLPLDDSNTDAVLEEETIE